MRRNPRQWLTCLALLCGLTANVGAAPQRPLTATHLPALARNLTPIKRANATDHLRLAISLPMRDDQAWSAFLQDLYNPASPNFHRFLTPAQVAERFGPSAADYQAVIDFAKAQGLNVIGVHPNRLIVDVDGTVATVEKVFHTTIQVYQHPTENRTFYAPMGEPSVDLATPILHITGLDNYFVRRPMNHKVAAQKSDLMPRSGSALEGDYIGGDFRAAYVPGAIPRGEGQAVALVEFDGYFASDIRAYESQAGMTNVPLINILIDGFNGIPYSGGETEVTLDIDMAVAMAPGLAQVLVYESTNGAESVTLDQLNRIATDNAARQISCSWGLDDNPSFVPIYQAYAAQGQSFFQASGDLGAFVPFTNEFDSDSPFVTLVGGTTLFTSGPGGSYVSEKVWNWNSLGIGVDASGGGFSTNFALPVWQEGFANSANLGSTQFRNCPDVALAADNIYIVEENGKASVGNGGTSCAAPLWAGFMALVNEQGAQNGLAPIGFANPTLYSIGKSALYESLFHDITVGNNTNASGGPIDYPAVRGYDLATGLGTPTAALINALAPLGGPVLRPIKSVISGGNDNNKIDPNECNDLTVTITNAGPVEATGIEGVLVSDSYPEIAVGESIVAFPDVAPFSSVTAAAPFTISSSPDFACGSIVQLALTLKSDQGNVTTPINLTTFAPCQSGTGSCAGADLSITLSASPNPVIVGSNFVCTLVASNAGPSAASDVVVQENFPPGTGFVAAHNVSQGTVAGSSGGATWGIGSLPVGGTATADVVALSSVPGTIATVTATINSTASDPNLNNNTASASVAVELPGADLGVVMSAAPNPALQNGRIAYNILVTNNGPFAAQGATLTTVIPNVNFVSAVTSQGAIVSGGAQINFGTIRAGAGASVKLVVSPTTTGDITAVTTTSLSISEIDPVQANNTAVATTTVNESADLGVTASDSPNPSIAGSNIVYVATFTNRGPATATDVVLTQLFPLGSRFVSTSVTGANIETNAGSLVWNIGVLSNGFGGTVTTVLSSPTNVGPGAPPVTSTFTISGQPGDPNTNDNVVVLTTVNSNVFLKVVAAGATLLQGNAIDPGSTVSVDLILQNVGNVPTTDLTALLLPSNGVVNPNPSGLAHYGFLEPGATATNTFTFTANGTNGGTLIAQLKLQDGATGLGVANFDFTLPVFATFSNTNFISIPDQRFIPNPDSGPANPYPSTIVVSNMAGLVSQVTVTLSNMSHSFPHDISMLLVSPAGLQSILMSSAAFDSVMTNVNVTFTPDPTAAIIPENGAIVSGLYQPANYSSSNYFPNPAPGGPYEADLGIFAGNGTNLNGAWSLYIMDNSQGDAGNIGQGWALSLKTIVPVNKVADLGISVAQSSAQLLIGDTNTFMVTVTNAGPDETSATIINTLPSGLSFVSAALPQGSFVVNGQTITYNLGAVPSGAVATFTTRAVAHASGPQINSFAVQSSNPTVFDPNGVNNTASITTTVVPPAADVVALITPFVAPVVVGRKAIYTLAVSNAGPQVADAATGAFALGSLTFAQASMSQGTFVVANGMVACSFGDVAAGDIATVQITVEAQANGVLTNEWVVRTSSADPILANNTNWVVVEAVNPTPIMVAGPALLWASGSNSTIAANETVTVSLAISNIGYAPTTNLTATLQAGNGISPMTASQNYGAIAAGAFATEPFTFVASGAPGATVVASLSLADGAASYPTISYFFTLPNSVSFSNTGAILIPDIGAASPYPSSILVSTNGVVNGVTVAVRGFSHSFPRDVNMLLAGPAGQMTLLEAHAGGPFSVSNLTLTFDDAASNSLPETILSSGTYLGTAYAPIDALPGFSSVTMNTFLRVFDGTNPNGVWSLYVDDDSQGNNGVISQGWGLNLSLITPVNSLTVPARWQATVEGEAVLLTLTAAPSQEYVVQISSDLISWTTVSTNVTDSTGAFTVTVNSANAPRRFYRAILQP